jgi:S-adenosylmethionine:tRNA ribosyltransferase-isomerase
LSLDAQNLLVSDFDFYLPEELIAQAPPEVRDTSRMMVLDRATGAWRDSNFSALPTLLRSGDLLIRNNSRVIPARLYARRTQSRGAQPATGAIEVLLTEQLSDWQWRALVRPGRKVNLGEELLFESENTTHKLQAVVTERGEFGARTLDFTPTTDFYSALDALGHMPLPPYIHRSDEPSDRERYQTIYAETRGSVAAPTAGLHFTPQMDTALRERGVELASITLHVGLGTFAPLRVERLSEIELHRERYTLPAETAAAINAAKHESRRILAVGTTTVRTLEHCAREANGATLAAHSGSTNIFLSPGTEFRLVQGLLTNFHLPQSSLLMLISAFAGREQVLSAYNHAVAERYRFFSYGDCMFIS